MQKPADFDNVQAFGEFKPLPAGGYVCRIMAVEETAARASGAPMIKVSLDIAEGQYKDYFANLYKSSTKADKKWSPGAIVNQLVYDTNGNNSTNRGFKTFCTAAEESNRGFMIQWGNNFAGCFKNRLVGVIFRREEYMGTDGKTHWSTKANSFRSVQTIREGKFDPIPDKPLDGTQGGYAYGQGNYTAYNPAPAQAASVPSQTAPATAQVIGNLSDFEEIPAGAVSDLPF